MQNKYSTVTVDDGVNYREIADLMTIMGFPMNHSSARNHVLRTMKKFYIALAHEWDLSTDEESVMRIVKTPNFQHGIADLLQRLEAERRIVSTSACQV